jgi:hypothetical protein
MPKERSEAASLLENLEENLEGEKEGADLEQQAADDSKKGLAKVNEKVGITMCMSRAKAQVKAVKDKKDAAADKLMITQLRVMLGKIGNKVKKGAVDKAMPAGVKRFVTNLVEALWPEIEKGIIDSFMLEVGLQFKAYRLAMRKHDADPPTELFPLMRATLLHSQMPYDLTFWSRMRNPLYAFIFMIFLFPLYGVDAICVTIYWLCLTKLDEYQLVEFIIKCKGLQFLTGGLMAGALGFNKLYQCTIQLDQSGPKGCWKKAPGTNKTFFFEFSLLLLRTFLVWVTFTVLWNFEEVNAYFKKQAAKAATSDPRRGLIDPKTKGDLLAALGFAMTLVCLILGVVNNGGKSMSNVGGIQEFLATSSFDVPIITIVFVTVPYMYLMTNAMLTWQPAAVCAGFAAVSAAYFAFKTYESVALGAATTVIVEEGLGIAIGALAMTCYSILVSNQKFVMAQDEANEQHLMEVITALDRDGDGEVSKAEFRKVFKELFPKSSFEVVWKKLDKDQSGTLTMAELANYFGMGHLVKQDDDDVEAYLEKDALNMAELEDKLEKTVGASKLSGTAGGALANFLVWDVIAVSLAALFVTTKVLSQHISFKEWRFGTSLFFAKMMVGLMSLPFLVFKLPVIKGALTHTRPTAYDRAGNCVPKLPKSEVDRRYQAKIDALMNKPESELTADEKAAKAWDAYLSGPPVDPVAEAKKKAEEAKEAAKAKAADEAKKNMSAGMDVGKKAKKAAKAKADEAKFAAEDAQQAASDGAAAGKDATKLNGAAVLL